MSDAPATPNSNNSSHLKLVKTEQRDQDRRADMPSSSGLLSGPAGVLDPHKIQRQFPERWRDFIRTQYPGGIKLVIKAFDVSEKTARNWWNADTGVNGGHVAVAVNKHPETAIRMLFAAE